MNSSPGFRLLVVAVSVGVLLSSVAAAAGVSDPHGSVADHGTEGIPDDPTTLCPPSYPSGETGSWSLVRASERELTIAAGVYDISCSYSLSGRPLLGEVTPTAVGGPQGSSDREPAGYVTFHVVWRYSFAGHILGRPAGEDLLDRYCEDPSGRAVNVTWTGYRTSQSTNDEDEPSTESWDGFDYSYVFIGPDDPAARSFAQQLQSTMAPYALSCAARPSTSSSSTSPPAQRENSAMESPPVLFGGYALVYNENGQTQDLEEVMVVLHVVEDGTRRAYTTYTEVDGTFGFAVPDVSPDATYQVEVRLTDEDGMFAVYRHGANTVLPVGYTTAPRSVVNDAFGGLVLTSVVFEDGMAATDPVHLLGDGATRDGTPWTGEETHEAALVYANVQTALEYARDRLFLPVTSTGPNPRLTVTLDPGAEGSVFLEPDRIVIGGRDISVSDPGHPETEYHEVGHYVHYMSGMGGVNNVHPRTGESHGGAWNPTSTDSMTEGWASFYAVLVNPETFGQDPPLPFYLAGNTSHNLQRNSYGTYTSELDEEWRVAQLLWDLMDDDRERLGTEQLDHVAMGLSRLWAVLDSAEDLSDVGSLYEAVKRNANESVPGDPHAPTPIDFVFVAHGFYAEENGQEGWQPGEEIGYSDFFRSAPSRQSLEAPDLPAAGGHSPDTFEGPWLDVTVTDEAGRVVPVSRLRMEAYGDGWTDAYDLRLAGSTGRIPFFLPQGADGVRLTTRVPGYGTDVVEVSSAEYQRYLDTWGRHSVAPVTMRLPARDVAPPAGFRAERGADGTVSLTWTPSDDGSSVVVVRRDDRAPSAPGDGVVRYEGAGGNVVDRNPAPVGRTHYAAFVVGPEGGVSPPAVATVQAPQLSREQVLSVVERRGGLPASASGDGDTGVRFGVPTVDVAWLLLPVVAVVFLFVGYFLRRR